MRVKAYAKVNLFLEITGKRTDGYHTLSTVFQTISLADELSFHPHTTPELTCTEPGLPVDERNLALCAAVRFQKLFKTSSGIRLTLKKNIPLGAGLGGGSSDAAAVLLAMSRMRRQPVTSKLSECARELGADVPFFLTGGTCLGEGIGDQITPLHPLPRTWMVLVYPGFGVATREAYAQVRLPFEKTRSVQKFMPLLKMPSETWAGLLFNRFEEFVFPVHPQLTALKQELLDAGALGALMSGSGSSLFGVVPSPARGRQILNKIRPRYPRSWLVHTV